MIIATLIVINIINTSCSSTIFASSWREPDKTVSIEKLNKVLLVALFQDETSRRKADGFDGAVTMRLVDVDKEKTFTPGNVTYYPTTKTYTIETNVYSIKEDKIIWSGLTETTNPEGVKKMTEKVSEAVFKKMVKEGSVSK